MTKANDAKKLHFTDARAQTQNMAAALAEDVEAPSTSVVDTLIWGPRWTKLLVSYSFPDNRNDYASDDRTAEGMTPVSDRMKHVMDYSLTGYSPYVYPGYLKSNAVSNFTHLSFSFAGTDQADIRIAAASDLGGLNGQAYPPGDQTKIWILDTVENRSPGPGDYSFQTALHEVGHALGLKHPQEAPVMDPAYDGWEFTLMSYKPLTGGAQKLGIAGSSPQTFMMLDIAALQKLYYPNFNINSGNTVYTWDTDGSTYVNGEKQLTSVSYNIFMTIWDGGGNDTYDFSNYHGTSGDAGQGINVDLRPGKWSLFSQDQAAVLDVQWPDDGGDPIVHYARGNVYNALQYNGDPRSLIENAIAGDGGDRMVGNDANNRLEARGGADVLVGGLGSDTLLGGEGDDILMTRSGSDLLDGGSGVDLVSYEQAATGLQANLSDRTKNIGEAAGDIYVGIENLCGSTFGDTLVGNAGANWLAGDSGNDFLQGEGGQDDLWGEQGSDTLIGGAGADILRGAGAGGDPDDGLKDWASYRTASGAVTVNLANLALNTGDAAGDTYVSIEVFEGSRFGDQLIGDAQANTFYGAAGEDSLFGGGGQDVLSGGIGYDRLEGGAAADQFLFNRADGGGDTIVDWQAGTDKIALKGFGFTAISSKNFNNGIIGQPRECLFYNPAEGILYYDRDGTLSDEYEEIPLACFTNRPASLSIADFVVLG